MPQPVAREFQVPDKGSPEQYPVPLADLGADDEQEDTTLPNNAVHSERLLLLISLERGASSCWRTEAASGRHFRNQHSSPVSMGTKFNCGPSSKQSMMSLSAAAALLVAI